MKFAREQQGVAERAIATAICDGLFADKRVLWLVSGGSNIAIEKEVMDMVRVHANGRLSKLAVMPIDERYGSSGHKDSNVEQLRQAGFDCGEGMLIDVLIHDLPFDETVSFYNEVASAALANAAVVVGQFGMGSDGHVAGIKPDSPATEIDESTVTGYVWDDYTRMTLSVAALRQVTIGFLVAYGADKKPRLDELKQKELSFAKLPALLLYEIPKVTVFNDQMGARTKQ